MYVYRESLCSEQNIRSILRSQGGNLVGRELRRMSQSAQIVRGNFYKSSGVKIIPQVGWSLELLIPCKGQTQSQRILKIYELYRSVVYILRNTVRAQQ